jgi:hypothetical protein
MLNGIRPETAAKIAKMPHEFSESVLIAWC